MADATHRRYTAAFWVAVLCLLAGGPALADRITVQAAVEKQQVYVGEPFIFQIQVEGTNKVSPPDLGQLDGFRAEFLGGQANNSTSISMINGRTTQTQTLAYHMNYRLTALRVGRLTIPAVQVEAEQRRFRTRAITITALKPQSSDDFQFELKLSKTTAYVGEPIVLTGTWCVGAMVRSPSFSVPALQNAALFAANTSETQKPGTKYYEVFVNNERTLLREGAVKRGGKQVTALSFEKVIVPREAGDYAFSGATVAFEALVGQRQRRSIFDGFLSGGGSYRGMVVPASEVKLKVKPLPQEGRPPGFSGLVGRYHVATEASPVEVGVGDPITLTVHISGPPYLEHVELPPLHEQSALAERFKIPQERSGGRIETGVKTFTQSIRALNGEVDKIPPIELHYFDTKRGEYRVAKSKAIPLTVRETTMVTSEDIEGVVVGPGRSRLTELREGIAANYTDPSVLVDQTYATGEWLRSPAGLALLAPPPIAYGLLFAGVLLRRKRNADPKQRRARRALATFEGTLAAIPDGSGGYAALLEAVCGYLGAKLDVAAGALTYEDVAATLATRGVGEGTLTALEAIFEACMAHQYTGGQGEGASPEALAAKARETVQRLEKEIVR